MISGRIVKHEDDRLPQLGLPRAGKIKIGEPKQKNAPGRAIDYFRPDGNYAGEFIREIGKEANRIQIVFPSHDPTLVCYQRIEGWTSDARKAFVSDGRRHKLYSDQAGDYVDATDEELQKAMEDGITVTSGYGNNRKTSKVTIQSVSEMLTLRFILIKLKGIMGYWELSTKGAASSIPNIIQTFDNVLDRAGEYITNVVFDLSVSMEKSYKPGSQSRFPVLTLTPNISYENTLLLEEFKDSGIRLSKIITDDNIDNLLNNKLPESKQLGPAEPQKESRKILTTEALKKAIASKIKAYGNDKTPIKSEANLISELLYRLEALINEDEMENYERKLKTLLNFLFEKSKVEELGIAEGKAMLDWLAVDNGLITDEAVTEFNQIINTYDTGNKQNKLY